MSLGERVFWLGMIPVAGALGFAVFLLIKLPLEWGWFR